MPAAVNSSVVNSTRTVEVKTMESLLRCLLGAMAVLCITSRVHQRCRPVAAPLVARALQSNLHVLHLPSCHSNARRGSFCPVRFVPNRDYLAQSTQMRLSTEGNSAAASFRALLICNT